MRGARCRNVVGLLRRHRHEFARSIDANDPRLAVPPLLALVRRSGQSDEVTRGGEHRSSRAARAERQVDREHACVGATHESGRPPLVPAKRRGQREDLLLAGGGRRAAARASKRHRRDRCHDGGIDPDHGNVALTIGLDDGSHDLDRPGELDLDGRRVANHFLVRDNESGRIDKESRRVCSRSPQFDDAVQPLLPQQPDIVRGAPIGVGRPRSERFGDGVGEREVEGCVAAGHDVQGLPPVIGLPLKHQGLVRLDRVVGGAQPHADGAIETGEDSAYLHRRRIVADDQCVAGNRRGASVGVGHGDSNAECHERLARGRDRGGNGQRCDNKRAAHDPYPSFTAHISSACAHVRRLLQKCPPCRRRPSDRPRWRRRRSNCSVGSPCPE